jgi:hypothetical protein
MQKLLPGVQDNEKNVMLYMVIDHHVQNMETMFCMAGEEVMVK